MDEAADLGAQLPALVRGLYYEGWDPSRTPRKMDAEEFTATFARQATLPEGQDPQHAIAAAFRVLQRNVTEGEVDDVLKSLPVHVRQLLASSQ